MKGSRDFGAQLFTALLRALGIETRLIFSLQPLGYSFGKLEDAHRLERRKDDLDKDVNDQPSPRQPAPSKKRKRQKAEDSDSEDLGLPKVKGKGISILGRS
jgi:xeroderma pigmentosum group C-complementing protein